MDRADGALKPDDRCFAEEGLVEIEQRLPRLSIFPIYAQKGIPGAPFRLYVRQGVMERLEIAARLLPKGYGLIVYDAWRTFDFQQQLYQHYQKRLQEELAGMVKSFDEWINQYVAPPLPNRDDPPPHTTGGAVDVTLSHLGKPVDMGTAFDAFTPASATDWFKRLKAPLRYERVIAEHRELLCSVMEAAGFVNYPAEWWHYDYGNRRWAEAVGRQPLYRGIWTYEEAFGYVHDP